jgi:glycosyltransferase involved in cell wall biosynthesis
MQDTLSDLTIYILSCERAFFLRKTIDSVLSQKKVVFKLIVSDNSSTNSIIHILQNEYPDVSYIAHCPPLSFYEHCNYVLSKVDTKYCMVFHDDDLMLEDCLFQLKNVLDINSDCVACCGNAYILKNEKKTARLLFFQKEKIKKITSAEAFLEGYLNILKPNVAPFPGYMYRTEIAKLELFENVKNSAPEDVLFLTKILQHGSFYILKKPLIFYRIHISQLSKKSFICAGFQLVQYVCRTTQIKKRSSLVRLYLIHAIARTLRVKKYSLKRKTRVGMILIKHYISMLLKENLVAKYGFFRCFRSFCGIILHLIKSFSPTK